jgi:hypothetical protein
MRQKKDSYNNKIETVYKTTVKYLCPTRGWVEQEVEVKRFKATTVPEGTVVDADMTEVAIETDTIK